VTTMYAAIAVFWEKDSDIIHHYEVESIWLDEDDAKQRCRDLSALDRYAGCAFNVQGAPVEPK
jgi:hypothetical protein